MHSALLSSIVGHAAAQLSLGSFLSDSMVLQRAPEHAALWGSAAAGGTVSVSLDGVLVGSAVADVNGTWEASLPPQPPGIGHALAISAGAHAIHLSDIAFGDVYLCTARHRRPNPHPPPSTLKADAPAHTVAIENGVASLRRRGRATWPSA